MSYELGIMNYEWGKRIAAYILTTNNQLIHNQFLRKQSLFRLNMQQVNSRAEIGGVHLNFGSGRFVEKLLK